jgi:hypothetical protein
MSMSQSDAGINELEEAPFRGIDRREFMKITIAGAGAMILGGCSSGSSQQPTSANFAVMSDLHYYDPTLGTTSTEFLAYVAGDRKMIAQSQELLNAAVAGILSNKPEFVLVPGDLTKDGEMQNHQQVANIFKSLNDQGIKVYVVPGNHDINNPASLSYTTSPPTPIANVSPANFKSIYNNYGYGAALAQDPNSLSYVAEPIPGLWLIAIDSCEYANNAANIDQTTGLPAPVTAGSISNSTLTWIQTQLAAAKQQGKTIIGMLHHGLLEHFPGESTIFPDYVLSNWQTLSKTLSDAGLTVVFTGHFHANDVVRDNFTSSVLYDIETGSLVTAACPYRFIQLDLIKQAMTIATSRITAITSHPSDFTSFSQNFLYNGLATPTTGLVPQMLTAPTSYGGFGLSSAVANSLAPLISFALMAHYYGDENGLNNASSASQVTVSGVPLATYAAGVWSTLTDATDPGSQFRNMINAVWIDTAPQDANVTFTLDTTTATTLVTLFRQLFIPSPIFG